MKLNRIALAVLITAPLSVAVHADSTDPVDPVTNSFPGIFGKTTGLGLSVTPLGGWSGLMDHTETTKHLKQSGSQAQFPTYGHALNPYDDFVYGVAVGYELTPSFSTEFNYLEKQGEGSVHYTKSDGGVIQPGKVDVRTRSYELNGLLTSDVITHDYDGKFKPYALVGAGYQNLVSNDKGFRIHDMGTIVNLGLGAFYRLNDTFALRGEGRAVSEPYHGTWDWKALAGLQITLGGHKRPYVEPPPPAPAPAPAPVVVPPPAPQELTEDLKLELRVFFDTNKSIIKKQYQPEIAKVADKLKEFSNASAEIKGY
uniref:outer membrane beta-barrel protein n=1 Tax=Aquirhabdus sp. TaxID=2824160 RepID=UPI00396C584C